MPCCCAYACPRRLYRGNGYRILVVVGWTRFAHAADYHAHAPACRPPYRVTRRAPLRYYLHTGYFVRACNARHRMPRLGAPAFACNTRTRHCAAFLRLGLGRDPHAFLTTAAPYAATGHFGFCGTAAHAFSGIPRMPAIRTGERPAHACAVPPPRRDATLRAALPLYTFTLAPAGPHLPSTRL